MASHGVPRSSVPEHDAGASEESRQEEARRIDAYRDLIHRIEIKRSEKDYSTETLTLTSRLLKENPEYYTIWNVRREVLIHGIFAKAANELPSSDASEDEDPSAAIGGSIRAELDFILPLMMSWPKCYWIWKYRLWLLEEANKRLPVTTSRELWTRELGFVAKMLTKDKRNFHGWGYRRSVVAQLESARVGGQSLAEEEFEYSTRMIHVELKNFSAWHHRSKLIPRLLNERNADPPTRKEFLTAEFKTILNAIWTDQPPYDQSVWFYHQYLMINLTQPDLKTSMIPDFTLDERLACVEEQIEGIKDFLDGGEDCKWAYIALIDATRAIPNLQKRSCTAEEHERLLKWLDAVVELDPMRRGRWDDLREQLAKSSQV